MKKERAYCPNCGSEGAAGSRCPSPACRATGYHAIPTMHFEAFRELPKAVADPRIGQKVAGFLVVDRLGRGAFGYVYLAILPAASLEVAVKVLDPASDGVLEPDRLADMFAAEARALGRIGHPNVVRLLAYDPDHDPPALAMEYVGASTLADEMSVARKRGERLGARRAGSILEQLLFALQAAHDQQLVHLDLRPDNVGLQRHAGYTDFVRLLDFGLATRIDEDDGLAFGTAEYIAPERLRNEPASPTADLYAVGVMAFELLAGKSIFGTRSRGDIVEAKQDPTFDPSARLESRRYAPFVVKFFRTALAYEAAQRFPDATVFATRLRPVVDYFSE